MDWKIERKTVKELADMNYDGSREKYNDWYELMRTHLISCNHGFGRILFETEQ